MDSSKEGYVFIGEEREIIKYPLKPEQARGMMDGGGLVEAVIEVSLHDLLYSSDIDDINDIADEKILESGCLRNMTYEVIGCSGDNTVLILVSGELELDDNWKEGWA